MNEITPTEITPKNTAIILRNIQYIRCRLDRMTGTLDRMISRLEKPFDDTSFRCLDKNKQSNG
jgi:hypothetical protein